MLPESIQWRWHRLQDALARSFPNSDFIPIWIWATLTNILIALLTGGAIAGGIGASVAVTGVLISSAGIGGVVFYCAALGAVGGGLPYGWIRTNSVRWLETRRNEKEGWTLAEKQVRIENPRRGDFEWRALKPCLGFDQSNFKTKRVLLGASNEPVTELPGEFWDFQTQKIMRQLEAPKEEKL